MPGGALQRAPDPQVRRAIAHMVDDRIKRTAAMIPFEPADRTYLDVLRQMRIRRA